MNFYMFSINLFNNKIFSYIDVIEGKETILFKIEEKMDVLGVPAFLRDLADKIDSHKV